MAYDALDRETSVQEPYGQALTYGYDAAGNQTSERDSQGGTTTSVYDALDRLTSQQFGGPGQTTLRVDFAYTPRDQVGTMTYYTDLAGTQVASVTTYAYDPALRLTGITQSLSGGAVLASYAYGYDEASRLTSEVDNGGATLVYAYDAADQLTQAGSVTYGYDPAGNRTNTGYTTGSANELTGDGTSTYAYDAEGNELSKRDGSDITTYTYDNADRLTGVVETVGGTLVAQATYVYDVFGDRLSTSDYTQSGGTQSTSYAYDGANAWADLNSSGQLQTRRLYGESGQLLARVSGTGTAAWYLTDRQGSVRNIVNYAGSAALDTISYDAYGNKTSETSPANGDRYGYTGQQFDAAVGLQLNDARYYDAATGRWQSQDPLRFAAGDPNLYRYVGNSPTNGTDPSGLAAMMLGPGGSQQEEEEGAANQPKPGVLGTLVWAINPVGIGVTLTGIQLQRSRLNSQLNAARAAQGLPPATPLPNVFVEAASGYLQGIKDGAIFELNGATFGKIGPLSRWAQQQRQGYPDAVYWISTVSGSVAIISVSLAAGTAAAAAAGGTTAGLGALGTAVTAGVKWAGVGAVLGFLGQTAQIWDGKRKGGYDWADIGLDGLSAFTLAGFFNLSLATQPAWALGATSVANVGAVAAGVEDWSQGKKWSGLFDFLLAGLGIYATSRASVGVQTPPPGPFAPQTRPGAYVPNPVMQNIAQGYVPPEPAAPMTENPGADPIEAWENEGGALQSGPQVANSPAPQTSGLNVVPRPGMTSRTVTAPNGRTLTVWGQAEAASSTTPGHAEAMNNLATQLAATGEYEYVTIQRSWRTATGRVGNSRSIPDVVGVRRNGVVDAWEVQSATDVEAVLRQRLRNGMNTLPPARRGQINVIPPEPPVP